MLKQTIRNCTARASLTMTLGARAIGNAFARLHLRSIVGACALAGCGGQLQLAPEAEVAPGQWVPVGSPPPPALPEEVAIPEGPQADDLVWTDGCWQWSVGRWVWMRGGWVESPQDATYFHGKLAIAPDGRLLWAPCTWMLDGDALGFLDPRLPALYPPTERTVQR